MAIRREWGDVGTIGQLGALAGQAQAQREAQQQAFQMAQQQQAIQAQMAQQQMQIDQQNKALGIQLQRDQMQNEMQLAAQRMQMEWQAQMGVLDQQNKFQFEQYKWQARQQYELEKEMKYLAELDSRESALDRAYAEGDITDLQYARLKEMIRAERYTGQPDDAVWRMEQAVRMIGEREAAKPDRPERTVHPSSFFQPRAGGPSPVEESITPFISELEQLPPATGHLWGHVEPPDETWERIGSRLQSIGRRKKEAKTFMESQFAGWYDSYAPTEQTAIKAYERWRAQNRYHEATDAEKRVMDATWDEVMRRRRIRDARGELIWNPESENVQKLRDATLREPTEQEVESIIEQVMQNPALSQAVQAGDITLEDAARQMAAQLGYKI